MKKLIAILALSSFLFSCTSGPENAAKNFTENLAKGKVDKAKKYATESTGKILDFATRFGGIKVDPNFKFNLVKDSIADDKAWVTFKNQDGEEQTVEVVKIDGVWLVHLGSQK